MSFQMGLFCKLLFHKIETTLPFVFFIWSVPDVATLCSFSSDHRVQLIKKCELSMLSEDFTSKKQTLCHVALPWWRPKQAHIHIFSHIWEKGWRGGWWQRLDSLFPKPFPPFIAMLETFCQMREVKEHSGSTTAGFCWLGAERACWGTDCVTLRN